MYFIYLLSLLSLVYIVPALAVWPKLLLSSRTSIVIPFVSIAIVILLQKLLSLLGLFSHGSVLLISGVSLIVAIFRLKSFRKWSFDWPKPQRFIFALGLLLFLYFSSSLGTHSFDAHDEIYSWNMWAVQHYLGEEPDYYYTKSPYPQGLPILLAYAYKLLGSIELQLPVKASLAIFPFCLFMFIGLVSKNTFANTVNYLMLLVLLLILGLGAYLDDGLADPLMTSAIMASVYCFIMYQRQKKLTFLWLSVISGIVALYTKQPALIWALFAFPVLSLGNVLRKKLPNIMIIASVLLILVALLWIYGEGQNFYSNRGVIKSSQNDRQVIEQLLHSGKLYLWNKPLFAALLIVSLFSAIKSRRHIDLFLFLLLPSLVLWFLFGAYSFRLGIHIAFLAALILAANDYASISSLKLYRTVNLRFHKYKLIVYSLLTLLILFASLQNIGKSKEEYGKGFNLYIGGKNTIYKYFGDDASTVFSQLYNQPQKVIWAPSNYLYGVFYGHNTVIRPQYNGRPSLYDEEKLLSEIQHHQPDYLFDAGNYVAYGPASRILRRVAIKCNILDRIASPPNKYAYSTYKLKKDAALLTACYKAFSTQ